MALLWCDGFDHYGVVGNMTEGAWAEISAAGTISATQPRTGLNSFRDSSTNQSVPLRRVLGSAKTTVGIAGAFWFSNLPTGNGVKRLFDFRDTANNVQVSIIAQSTGTIAAYRGSAIELLGTSASTVIVANAYQHIEALVFFSNTVGTIEVRVNGVTVLSLSGIDTVQSANVECSQVGFCGSQTGGGHGVSTMYLDDVFCYDETGSFNNTFIGDRRVLTLFPNANTVQADWTAVGAATGYECIDEANPDGDTTYISAGLVGSPRDVSEFGLDNLPSGISAISGIVLVNMSRKTEAGTANVQWSIISGASEAPGIDNPMTEIYTYRQDVFETDPSTAAPFTSDDVDALTVKVERTA